MNKTVSLKLFTIFCLIYTFVGYPTHVHAGNEFCQPDKTLFMKLGDAFQALDIRKTVTNMLFSAATDGVLYAVNGRSGTQTMNCAHYIFKQKGIHSDLVKQIEDTCPGQQQDDPSCADLMQTTDGTTMLPNGTALNQTRVSGSLLGVAISLENAATNEPLPVNLAYYWNDSIKTVPFASTALAADVQYSNAPFIGFILDMWKVTRNLSYGILSIIMLVVGVSIMMRKKLSPQAVVTAQYALPRIVLAVILITFSYPIGAVLASSMKFILTLSNGLISDVVQSSLAGTTADPQLGAGIGIGMAVLVFFAAALSVLGVGAMIIIFIAVLCAVAVFLYIFVLIKAMMLYIKLIFSILFAPFSFALGAIPGNEASTEKWFKSAISNVLGASFSIAYAHLVLAIMFIAVSKGFSATSLVSGTVGSIIIVIFFPVFVIFGFIQATKVPGKLNTLIMGEEKRPGGKK